MSNLVFTLMACEAERWHPMCPGWAMVEVYVKAAEEGYAAAQFIGGLAPSGRILGRRKRSFRLLLASDGGGKFVGRETTKSGSHRRFFGPK